MKALLVIDVQNDFAMKDGKLYVDKGEEVISPIVDLIKDESGEYNWDLIVLTRDWHPVDHISFAKNHNLPDFSRYRYCDPRDANVTKESTLWPVHCVQDTWGSQLVDPLKEMATATRVTKKKRDGDGDSGGSGAAATTVEVVVVDKGFLKDREYYSAFNDIWNDHKTELDSLLRQRGVDEVCVVGLALDYCVKDSAISAAGLGYRTTVLLGGCTRAIASDQGSLQQLCSELASHNVSVEIPHIPQRREKNNP